MQARHLQDVAQGLLAPAPLDANAPAKGGGELLGLVPGGGGGLKEGADLLAQATGLLGPGRLHVGDLLLELLEGVGHGLELASQLLLGQPLAQLEALVGASEELVGDGPGRLVLKQLGIAGGHVLDDLDPGGGGLEVEDPRLGAIGPAPLEHGPDQGDEGQGETQEGDQDLGVHEVFLVRNHRRVTGCGQAGRRARRAWARVPSSSQSSSPPTGTPRASRVTSAPDPDSRSAR